MRVDINGALSVTFSLAGADTINARLDKLEARMNAAETVEKELEDDETALETQQKADEQTLTDNQKLIDDLKAAQVSPDVIAGFEATHAKFAALIRPAIAA